VRDLWIAARLIVTPFVVITGLFRGASVGDTMTDFSNYRYQ
jgi:hypothetical protein